jgi:4-amino-4-deoxy-L-arabinose transferase-like glycosyltransferase
LSTPTPALVPRRAAQRLPRIALLLFCAAYVLPGLFGRDPWRHADLTAFGYMRSLARDLGDSILPTIAGVPADGALLPYALGAAAIHLLGGWMDATFAARLPFALLLIGTLALTWYSCYHLARTEAAQPLPFAFGGEAAPIDYARAIADGALLALIATLGLLQLGHETTPELVQLFAATLFMYAMATSASTTWWPRVNATLALAMLAASGAPAIAVLFAAGGLVVSLRSSYPLARRFVPWLAAGTAIALAIATGLGAWGWRLASPSSVTQLPQLLLWFTWPAWPMALWTLWRWRMHLQHRHIAIPSVLAGVSLVACIGMGGLDRALMLGLPALAVLAAFALPTLQRSVSAAIDWFSVAFFSAFAIAIWVVYVALQTGVPAKTAANVARLVPGYAGGFSWIALGFAVTATLAWLLLVRWRTGRHRPVLWKSLVLPAGGLSLCWLLAMTLLLPVLDYARSYRVLVDRLAQHVPTDACVVTVGLRVSQLAALEYHGGWRVEAAAVVPKPAAGAGGCEFLMTQARRATPAEALHREGWSLIARERLPTDRSEETAVYRRTTAVAAR